MILTLLTGVDRWLMAHWKNWTFSRTHFSLSVKVCCPFPLFFLLRRVNISLRDWNQVHKWSPLKPSCSALVARRRCLVTISGSLRVPQAVILTKPLNQFIFHAWVRYSAILVRLFDWRTGSSWRLLRLYRRTGSTWRFHFSIRIGRRKRISCRKRWSFSSGGLFLPSAATSASHVLHRFLWHKSTDDNVCQRFYTGYGMTSWQRH